MPSGSEEPREEFTEEPNTITKSEKGKESKEVAGCSFAIYPMNSGYIEIIRSALAKVNMSKVWHKTDDVSTLIRGRISHVFDVSKAVFFQAADTGEHVSLRATYTIGLPGREENEVPSVNDDELLNQEISAGISRPVSVKFALYPLGDENYTDVIKNQIQALEDQDIHTSVGHYETRLEGDAEELFKGLEKVFRNTEMAGAHTVMAVTMVAHNIESR